MATGGKWSALRPKLDKRIVRSLRDDGMRRMTPVQEVAIPSLLERKDVVVEAETGSGKTLSFLVPLVQMMLDSGEDFPKWERSVFAVILEPTRELAQQVHGVAEKLFAAVADGLQKPALLVGGVDRHRKRGGSAAVLEAAERDGMGFSVCITTPGTFERFLDEGLLSTKSLELLVLDEADRLLDLGFQVALSGILDRMPKQRRTGLYSATQTDRVDELAKVGLRNPVRVRVEVQGGKQGSQSLSSTPSSLRGYYIISRHEEKLLYLLSMLASNPEDKVIVYFLTCAEVDLFRRLSLEQFVPDRPVLAISGRVWQKKRSRIMEEFRQSSNGVLLCTDVASRGLDVPDVDCVVQFDPPQNPATYVHRAGRTARLGRDGRAVLFLHPEEREYVDFLEVRGCAPSPLPGDGTDEARREALSDQVRAAARRQMLGDRAVVAAAEMAYLSYLRAYKEHHCSEILRFENLDAGSVARAFYLLRLPKVSEFKTFRKRIDFEPDTTVDYWSIPFLDPQLEEKRKREQAAFQQSVKERQKEREAAKKERDLAKSAAKKRKLVRGHMFDQGEIEDVSRDAAMLKRAKRGKLSVAELDDLGL